MEYQSLHHHPPLMDSWLFSVLPETGNPERSPTFCVRACRNIRDPGDEDSAAGDR